MKDNGSLNSVLRTARASGHSVNSPDGCPDLSLVADGNLMAWAVGQCRVHEET